MHILDRGERLPIITTERLVLRDIEIEDISDDYITWLNNPEINRYLEVRLAHQTWETVSAYIQDKLENCQNTRHFGVYDQGGTRLVGTATLPTINWHHRFSDISFAIGHPEVQRQGYGTEAVRALIHYAFDSCKLEKLVAGYYDGNEASGALLCRLGFKLEGRLRLEVVDYRGVRVDKLLMGLLKGEADY